MDFHSLARRDLQSLCKRNKIPANMTNIAMADALQALQSVEGIAEIQEDLQFQSPRKLDQVSPAPPPRTTGRRTASRKVVGPVREETSAEEEPREQQGSPLPRARRVTARAPLINEAEEEEGAMKEVPETPKAPNTRRKGASKKEEGAVAEALTVTTRRRATKKEVVETPAAVRTGRRVSALREAEAQKEENPAGATAGRIARQSSKKEVDEVAAADLMSEGLRRSTRVSGRGAAVKMTSFTKEEAQEKEAGDSVDQKSDDDNKEEHKEIKDNEKAIQEAEVSADLNTEEKPEKSSEESFELVGEVSENNQNQNQEEEEEKDQDEEDGNDAVASGFDGSPIRGLIDQDSNQQQQNPAAEFELQEPSTTVDLGSDKIAAEISAETTESGEFAGEVLEKSVRDTVHNDQTTEIVVGSREKCVGDKVTGDVHSETMEKTDESDDENGGDLVAVDVPVEIDESGTDLVAGEIAVEAIIEEQKQVPEIAGESRDEVGELIGDLSDLNLSAYDEMPPAVSSDNKENGGLTALTAVEVGPRGVVTQKFESMSLRKLKAVFKETLASMNTANNKVKEKRAALKAIDDNRI